MSRSKPANSSVQAAIARTASRGMALFFARPVRLFRPTKVNGWQILKHLASQQGTTLTHQYLISLVKLQGIWVIPKHFVPPMIVNASLGSVLWGAYGEASERLDPFLSTHSLSNSALSGAIAGASQAIVAAPAENVRILLERGVAGHSWSCAWKEVFREKGISLASTAGTQNLQDIRQLRGWLQEVGQMAGRGWNGWGWGLGKDTFGFAVFFFLFEISRRTGSVAKAASQDIVSKWPFHHCEYRFHKQTPPIVNGVTLVTGGVIAGISYEYTCRPWDVARREINLERASNPHIREPSYWILKRKLAKDGWQSFFRLPNNPTEVRTKWNVKFLRTAGRVGPWGIGFLVWEAYGNGLS
ncbi:hypothetical protein BDN70DRAFT_903977 [Pholiota conissans]|uniref:Mitochondrial carrier protein n=1 Tax=Pholiota conissans TaxID=109636 RepID=A0A9P5ZAD4_9AGAR|nr:hypothetical protein BDN70DRAFT_903977 [Pholiota conissans]